MVWILALIIFIVSLPIMMSQGMVPSLNKLNFYKGQDTLTFVSDLCDISLTLGGCVMCIFIYRTWGIEKMNAELEKGSIKYKGSLLQKYLNFTIAYVCPVLLGFLSVLIIIEKFFGLEKIF